MIYLYIALGIIGYLSMGAGTVWLMAYVNYSGYYKKPDDVGAAEIVPLILWPLFLIYIIVSSVFYPILKKLGGHAIKHRKKQ